MHASRVVPNRLTLLGAILMLFATVTDAQSQISLRVPSAEDQGHRYYHELLIAAADRAGLRLEIESIPDIPQLRRQAALEAGHLIDVDWYVETVERNGTYRVANAPVTNNLIGHRVFLIPRGESARYRDVRSVADLVALDAVAGVGEGWYDAQVWNVNGLSVVEVADSRNIFGMVANRGRGIDYFPRGIAEVISEAPHYPHLEVEPNLLLVYARDFRFYFSPQVSPCVIQAIERGLHAVAADGTMDRLLRRHFAEVFTTYRLAERRRIDLATH